MPGIWPQYPVVANFKQLAEEALSSCFIGQTIRVEVLATEAEASAQCILNQGQLCADNERYSVGNVVISCDIGGATTDVAISEIVGPGKLAAWSKLTSQPRGVIAFEQRFWEHTEQILRSAGAQEPGKWALEITKSDDLAKARNGFSKSYGDVAIPLPKACCIKTWQPPSRVRPSRDIIIKDNSLCIPRYGASHRAFLKQADAHCHSVVFEEFLAELVEEIEGAIEEAIIVLRDEFKNKPVSVHRIQIT